MCNSCQKQAVAVLIVTVDMPLTWAKQMWDSFYFDYDVRSAGERTITVWPLLGDELDMQSLKKVFDDNGIKYEDSVMYV